LTTFGVRPGSISLEIGIGPNGLAFAAAGDLFVANTGCGMIDEISPGGAVNTFVTATAGLNEPVFLAFSPVPVPSSLVLAAAGIVALAVWARAHRGTA
jgi:hypothetical protein